jgi:hypothetical protein
VTPHRVEGQLVLEVDERDREAARAGGDEAVGRVPGPHAPQEQVLDGVHAAHRPQGGVDSLGEGLDAAARAGGHRREIPVARRLELEGGQEAVEVRDTAAGEELVAARGRAQVADQLAQAPGAEVAQQVELEEAVSGLEETERGVEVLLVLGVDVGEAAGVAQELEAAARPWQVRGGEGRARAGQAPPGER